MGDSSPAKKAVVVIIAILAIAVAVWSAVRTFGPKGKEMGRATISAASEKTEGPGPGYAPRPGEPGNEMPGVPVTGGK